MQCSRRSSVDTPQTDPSSLYITPYRIDEKLNTQLRLSKPSTSYTANIVTVNLLHPTTHPSHHALRRHVLLRHVRQVLPHGRRSCTARPDVEEPPRMQLLQSPLLEQELAENTGTTTARSARSTSIPPPGSASYDSSLPPLLTPTRNSFAHSTLQHIETASVHRDDSDDDEEDDDCELDEPPPGWEDEYGGRVYPEENEAAAAALAAEEAQEARACSTFDTNTSVKEYWDEDEFHSEEYTNAELAAGVAALCRSDESPTAGADIGAGTGAMTVAVGAKANTALGTGIDAEEAIEELAKYFEVVEVVDRRRASV
ncbi:hypothetical protein EVG20_g5951 [Dentipellis fragilis]|uniref:Methyltransferase domain-containing protein n=1 Tax=Dentipellis fragilis TaxID=205917 RepID=A0A4Y9YPD0_9AGAM|nr:hypothetical protein EVG20_g5951 [Dentipellis fragilis]